jgi:hypothetical protein
VGVTFDWSSHKRFAIGSDNWPMTWSDDDNQYAMYGDGGGFGGNNVYTDPNRASFGVVRITGDYDTYATPDSNGAPMGATNRYGGVAAECPSSIIGKSHGAPISIGGVLYTWVTYGSDEHGYTNFTLYKSLDKACNWTQLNVAFTTDVRNPSSTADDEVAYGGFVQFGKDNQSAVDNYVYTVAINPVDTDDVLYVHKPGKIILIRVPRTSIEVRSAYEFFAGLDSGGRPTWSKNAIDKAPIITEPQGVGTFPQIVYVPELKRFVFTNQYGDGTFVQDKQGVEHPAGNKALLTMSQATNVWGPYTEFYRDQFVAPAGHMPRVDTTLFQWNFAPKWFRNKRDGALDFTMTF